ncbi:MAG: NlpC/P60 family protein, partial [Lachnospiraceae bacterium]
GHVGIYIGGGQMIHAPQPGDVVKVANVYGSPWFRRYW